MTDKPNPFAHLIGKTVSVMTVQKPEQSIQKIETPDGPQYLVGEPIPAKEFIDALLSPQTQLLGESLNETSQTAIGTVAEGLHELANLNTDSMEPASKPTTNIALKARQLTDKLVLDSAADVRQLCDQADELIKANPVLVGPPLVHLRKYVQQLMMTLKEHPEFDDVIIDPDVNNVMQYIRATREESIALRGVKTEKKAIRAAKKEGNLGKVKLESSFAAAFQKVMNAGVKK